jgi:MHS family alpha-ketoglutarate permease-like MFS transporter
VLQNLLTEAQLTAWGWRIPFVVGALLALGVFVLRRNLSETPAFANQAVDRPLSTARLLWRDHRRESILVAMLSAGGGVGFYAYTSYMQKYLINSLGFAKGTANYVIAAALLFFLVLQPVSGSLADRFGRKPMLLLYGIGGAIAAVPVFLLMERVTTPLTAFLVLTIPLLLQSGYSANNALVKAELFPAHIRGLGVALPYAIGNAIFGGTVEMIALALKGWGHERWFYGYVALIIAMAGLATLLLPETRERGLIED